MENAEAKEEIYNMRSFMLKCVLLQMSSNYDNRTPQVTVCIFVVKYKVELYIVGTQKFRERFSPGMKFRRKT